MTKGEVGGELEGVGKIPNLDELEGCLLRLPDARLMMNLFVNQFYGPKGRYRVVPLRRDCQYTAEQD